MTVPSDELYDAPGHVRALLGAEHINALVFFFLSLGNHLVDPQSNIDPQTGLGNPSTKLARFQKLGSNEGLFLDTLPPGYPLTDGLQRLTAVRALLDTKAYLQLIAGSVTPPFSQCFRTRAYDHTGQRWPALPTLDADCVGGALRAVVWSEDLEQGSGRVVNRGFQPRFLGVGGSIATLLALFPSNRPDDVDSYFWCTPGVQVMTSDPTRFDVHMNAFSTNTLLPTRYDDFLQHFVGTPVLHYYP